MRIDTKSWHYRWLWKSFREWKPPERTNLCAYFWRCVAAVPILVASAVGLVVLIPFVFVAVVVIGTVGSIVRIPIQYARGFRPSGPWGRILSRSDFVVPIEDKFWTRRQGTPNARQPSLLASWLRAKKERVCPIVEFEGLEPRTTAEPETSP